LQGRTKRQNCGHGGWIGRELGRGVKPNERAGPRSGRKHFAKAGQQGRTRADRQAAMSGSVGVSPESVLLRRNSMSTGTRLALLALTLFSAVLPSGLSDEP